MSDTFTPPTGVASAAKKGLELRRKFKRGGTSVGAARAGQLSNRNPVSFSVIKRMVSFFARHAVDAQGKDWNNSEKPSNGKIAHLLWGGNSGKAWANSIYNKRKNKSTNESTRIDQQQVLLEYHDLTGETEDVQTRVSRLDGAKSLEGLLRAMRLALATTASIQEQISIPITQTNFKESGGWISDTERYNERQRKEFNQQCLDLLNKPIDELSLEEREIFRKYSGFGGIKDAKKEAGSQYDYYTPPTIAKAQLQLANILRPLKQGDKVLEPSCGNGVFMDVLPDGLEVEGVELDSRTAGISQRLHGTRAEVHNKPFELYYLENHDPVDLVIGNAPFGDRDPDLRMKDDPKEKNLDRYFVKKALQRLKENGMMVMQVAPGPFKNPTSRDWRLDIMFLGKFMGAIRLPDESYKHSGSSFATPDILIFQRHRKPFKQLLLQKLRQFKDNEEAKVDFLQAVGLYSELWHEGAKEYYKKHRRHMLGEEKEIIHGQMITKGKINATILDGIVQIFKWEKYEENEDVLDSAMLQDLARGEERLAKQTNNQITATAEEIESAFNRTLQPGHTKADEDGNLYICEISENEEGDTTVTWRKLEIASIKNDILVNKITRTQAIAEQVRVLQANLYEGDSVSDLQRAIINSLKKYEQDFGVALFEDKDIRKIMRKYPLLNNINEAITLQKEKANVDEGKQARFARILTTTPEPKKDLGDVFDRMDPEISFMRKQKMSRVGPLTEGMVKELGGQDMLEKVFASDYIYAVHDPKLNQPIFLLKEDFYIGNYSEQAEKIRASAPLTNDSRWQKKYEQSLNNLLAAQDPAKFEEIDVFMGANFVSNELIQRYLDATYNRTFTFDQTGYVMDTGEFRVVPFFDAEWAKKYNAKTTREKIAYDMREGKATSVLTYCNFHNQKDIDVPLGKLKIFQGELEEDTIEVQQYANKYDRQFAFIRFSNEEIVSKINEVIDESPETDQFPSGRYITQEEFEDYGRKLRQEYKAAIQSEGKFIPLGELRAKGYTFQELPNDIVGMIMDNQKILDSDSPFKTKKDEKQAAVAKNNLTRLLNGVDILGKSDDEKMAYKRDFHQNFRDWLTQNEDEQQELTDRYNLLNNDTINAPKIDYPIAIEGWNPEYTLRGVQWQSVHHLLRNQKGIAALGVGFGKTFAAIALSGVLLQEKKANRIWVQVPNNKVKDWVDEYSKGLPALQVISAHPDSYKSQADKYRRYQEMANSGAKVLVFAESMGTEIQLSPPQDEKISEQLFEDQMKYIDMGTKGNIQGFAKDVKKRLNTTKARHAPTYFDTSFNCDAIISDECLPYHTPVATDQGILPIGKIVTEKLMVNVLSFNSEKCNYQYKPVTNWMEKPLNHTVVKLHLSNGESLVCTDNHKIWTEDGYIEARDIQDKTVQSARGARLSNMWDNLPVSQKNEDVLLFKMQEEIKLQLAGRNQSELWSNTTAGLRDLLYSFQAHTQQYFADDLFLFMCREVSSSKFASIEGDIFSKSGSYVDWPHRNNLRKICNPNARKQSYEQSRNKGKSFTKTEGPDISSQRWKWQTNETTIDATRSIRFAGFFRRICDQYKEGARRFQIFAESLQGRFSNSSVKTSIGSGREYPQNKEMEIPGQAQNRSIERVRVERVEILERGNLGRYGFRSARDSSVFDITVEDNHNFFANGVLVSNCHNYKGLFSPYKVNSDISQLNSVSDSNRGITLLKKYEYLRNTNGLDAPNTFGLTATPMSNSPLEFWNMLMHIDAQALRDNGITDLGTFVRQFCIIEQDYRISKDGDGEELKDVLTGFRNLDLLRKVFFSVVDYQVDRNQLEKDGAEKNRTSEPTDVIVTPTPEQDEIIEQIREEYEEAQHMSKEEREDDPGRQARLWHNLLTVSLDPGMLDPDLYGDIPNPKLNACVENVMRHWKESQSGQLIFCNRLNANKKDAQRAYNYHEKIKEYLIEAGFPGDKIGIINGQVKLKEGKKTAGGGSDTYTDKMIEAYNSGKMRILIGNTQCMGEGVNLQADSIAVHHLDIPHRPSDLVQRNGRVDRQGNKQMKTFIYNYTLAGSMDDYLLDQIKRKADWIQTLLMSKEKIFQNPDLSNFGNDPLLIQYIMSKSRGDVEAMKDLEMRMNIRQLDIDRRKRQTEALELFKKYAGAMMNSMKLEPGTPAYSDSMTRINFIRKQLQNNPEFKMGHLIEEDAPPFVMFGSLKEIERRGLTVNTPIIEIGDWYYHPATDREGRIDMSSKAIPSDFYQVTGFSVSSNRVYVTAESRLAPTKDEPNKPFVGYFYSLSEPPSDKSAKYLKNLVKCPKSFGDPRDQLQYVKNVDIKIAAEYNYSRGFATTPKDVKKYTSMSPSEQRKWIHAVYLKLITEDNLTPFIAKRIIGKTLQVMLTDNANSSGEFDGGAFIWTNLIGARPGGRMGDLVKAKAIMLQINGMALPGLQQSEGISVFLDEKTSAMRMVQDPKTDKYHQEKTTYRTGLDLDSKVGMQDFQDAGVGIGIAPKDFSSAFIKMLDRLGTSQIVLIDEGIWTGLIGFGNKFIEDGMISQKDWQRAWIKHTVQVIERWAPGLILRPLYKDGELAKDQSASAKMIALIEETLLDGMVGIYGLSRSLKGLSKEVLKDYTFNVPAELLPKEDTEEEMGAEETNIEEEPAEIKKKNL